MSTGEDAINVSFVDVSVTPAEPLPAASGVPALTARIVKGDDAAFSQFYDRYASRLFGLLMVLSGADESLSRELLQQTIIRAARKFRAFESEEKLWAWLSAIAKNALIDHRRSEFRRRKREQTDLPAAGDASGENRLIEHALPAALSALDPDEKELLNSFYFRGEGQGAIADKLGISTRAVEGRLARVRAKLRKLIVQEPNEA